MDEPGDWIPVLSLLSTPAQLKASGCDRGRTGPEPTKSSPGAAPVSAELDHVLPWDPKPDAQPSEPIMAFGCSGQGMLRPFYRHTRNVCTVALAGATEESLMKQIWIQIRYLN